MPDISISNPPRGAEDYSLPSISIGKNRLTNGLAAMGNYSTNRTSTNLETMRRVVMLGDQNVGKTSLFKRIVVRNY